MILDMQRLAAAMRERSKRLSTVFRHAASMLKSEILGQPRHKKECVKLKHEVALRKQAEERSAALSAIVEYSDDAIIGKTLEGIITSWNKGAEKIYGYTERETIGHPISLLVPPGLKDEVPGILARLRNGEHIDHYETRRQRKDGKIIEVALSISPIRNTEGAVIATSTIARDITERKRAEEEIRSLNASLETRVQQRTQELAQSEARFRTIYEIVPVSIWREDWTLVIQGINDLRAQGVSDFGSYFREHPEFVTRALGEVKILDINQRTVGMFAAGDKADMLASLKTVFNTDDTLPGFIGELKALAEGRPLYHTEMALNTVRGDRILAMLYMSFPPLDTPSGEVLVSLIDITEQKTIEHSLRRQATLIDRSPNAIIVRKLDGTILFWNRGAEAIYGWTKAEACGRQTHGLFQTQFSQPQEQVNEQIQSTGEWSGELTHQTKEGRTVIVQSFWLAQSDAQGQIMEILETNIDITDRKKADQALRESEERMRLFFERQLVGMAITSPQKGWVQVNDKICQMLGYSREELMQLTWAELTYPEDLSADVTRFERLLNGEIESYTLEKRFRRKDGSIVFTILSVGCVRRADGTVDYALSLLEDITERKHAEEALRALNATLEERVLERTAQLKEAIATLNTEIAERKRAEEALQRLNRELRAVSNCNQTLMRAEDENALLDAICHIVCDEAGYRMAWVGYAEHDDAKTIRPVAWAGVEEGYLAAAHLTWADTERGQSPTGTAIRAGDSAGIQDFATDAQTGLWREGALTRGYRSNIALPLKDENANTFGALTIYSAEPNAFTHGEIRLLEELAGDLAFGITTLRGRVARKLAIEHLRKEAERSNVLLELYEKAPQLTDIELYDFALNHAVQLTSSEIGFLHLVSDDQKTIILTAWNREALKNCTVVTETHYAVEKAGNWADCVRSGKPVVYNDFASSPNQKGIPQGHTPLRRFLSIPVTDGGKVVIIFGVGNKAKDYDDADVIHMQLVANELQKISKQRRADGALKKAKEAAESANHAKDQFIAVLSHELRTPLTPVLATVSALQAQEGVTLELRADIDMIRRNVEMEAKLVDDLLDVTKISRGTLELHPEVVDAHLLLRTALEICQQDIEAKHLEIAMSLQANPHQARADPTRLRQVFWNLLKNAVEFTPEKGRICLRTTNTNGRLKIEIEDSGIGIRPELLSKIFNAFERGDQTAFRRFGGLGLGLSIAKTVVEMHQGTLAAFSEGEGKGATFTVELPSFGPVSEQPSLPPPVLAQGKSLRKILLVDDHPDTLQAMSKLLRKWGYSVATADCVRAALEVADKQPFDVLLSDLGLPDGNGMDIMREVKRRYALRGIALSGYGTEEDIRRSLEAGFDKHLIKPVSFQDLRTALRSIISETE